MLTLVLTFLLFMLICTYGADFSSTLDFIGFDSRSLVSVIGKILLDANLKERAVAAREAVSNFVASAFRQPLAQAA